MDKERTIEKCKQKKHYPSKVVAKRALKRLRNRKHLTLKAVYKCICGEWCLTSREKKRFY